MLPFEALTAALSLFKRTRPHRATLSDLPEDVLMNIMVMLAPLEVLILRYTCKAANAASRQRWVWLKVLENHPPHSNGDLILPPSCVATASSSELERLATNSLLRSSVIRAAVHRKPRATDVSLKPRRRTTISHFVAPDTDLADYSKVPRLNIVPGGRYILVRSVDTAPWEVTLYKLHLDDPGARVVATLTIPRIDPDCYVGDYMLLQEGRILRVLVVETLGEYDVVPYFSIYQVILDDAVPTFRLYVRKQSTATFNSVNPCVALEEDCLICADGRLLHLVSLSRDWQKTWHHDTYEADAILFHRAIQSVHIVGAHVILAMEEFLPVGALRNVVVYSNRTGELISTGLEELELADGFAREDAHVYYPLNASPDEPLVLFTHQPHRPKSPWNTEVFRNPLVNIHIGNTVTVYRADPVARKRRSEEHICVDAFGMRNSLAAMAYCNNGTGCNIRLDNLSFPKHVRPARGPRLYGSFDRVSCRLVLVRSDGALEVVDYV
ncbi:hypothetical protein HDZ31DRAFT_45946 [Schizophyllum fasciatum]